MKIALFDFIDQAVQLYQLQKPSYEYVEGQIRNAFQHLISQGTDGLVSLHTRIKTPDSLREKMIRNKFYLQYRTPEEALEGMHDLIGITMQCRFIRNETQLYHLLLRQFEAGESEYSCCQTDRNLSLNLHMAQPQRQRNGFTIYRIDGRYHFNDRNYNFELQIKSLVHGFWSEIEHEVVYKNPDFVMYDEFNRSMLGAIRDNLDVVDRQLEIMYNEISYESHQAQIGMDEKGFKEFVARSINELVNRKMKESLGFTTDFRKCSAMIAQYIYIRDFVNGTHNRERMIDYLQLLNYLTDAKIDFSEEIQVTLPYKGRDDFSQIFGDYFVSVMNADFQWHVFFCMLFEIQPGSNDEDLSDFIDVIHILLIQPGWYAQRFSGHEDHGQSARAFLEQNLARALTEINQIEMIHEDRLYECMNAFRSFTEQTEEKYPDQKLFLASEEKIRTELTHRIRMIFES